MLYYIAAAIRRAAVMKTEDYIEAMEKIKEMHTQTGYALSMLLGALKGELNKVKKMPGT